MADNNFSELGRQMSDAVQEAIQSGNFTRLKQTVNTTVRTVVDKTVSFERTLEENMNRTSWKPPVNKQSTPPFYTPPYTPPKRQKPVNAPWRPYGQQQAPQQYNSQPSWKARLKERLRKVSFSRAKGITMIVFGVLCAVPLLILTLCGLFFGLRELAAQTGFFTITVTGVLFFPCTVLSVFLAAKGFQVHRCAGRYQQYYRLLGETNFCTLERLAGVVEKPQPFVKKELRRMLNTGMLPEGYMDEQGSYVILGAETYRQYCEAIESRKRREVEESKKVKEPEKSDELSSVIAEGKECIRAIREANNALPEEEISAKLNRLETVTTKIFAYVEQRPAKLPEIRRFMEYYLPTTIKLVGAYREFASQPVQGENIISAQAEIQEILGTINTAFETLLDSLFADDAIDISTDISALKTMFAQEGLSEKDFK